MIGLVTVLYKSNGVLEDFIRSLSIQTFKDFHLYIIDNSSAETDYDHLHSLLSRYPITSFSIIKNSQNLGVAAANNQGIEQSLKAGHTHTLLLNNDIEILQETVLEEMYRCARRRLEVLIIPKILFHGTRKIWMAGGKMLVERGTTDHVGGWQLDGPEYNITKYFDYAPTCFMMIDNKLFEEIGLMDSRYFVYYDDTDFIFRAVKKGYKVYYLPSCEVFHKESTSTGGMASYFSIFYMTRNRLFFVRKNYKGYSFIRAFGLSLFDILRVARRDYDRKGWKTVGIAIFKGFLMK